MSTEIPTKPADGNPLASDQLAEQIRNSVRHMLKAGIPAWDITYALTYVATELGLAVAKEPVRIFPVLLGAISQAVGSGPAGKDAPATGVREAHEVPGKTRFIDDHREVDMTRSSQVRAVYRELRQTLGDTYNPRQLITHAAALVELFQEPPNDPQFDLRAGGIPFEHWEVDRALADGGWRILAFERDRLGGEDDDNGCGYESFRRVSG